MAIRRASARTVGSQNDLVGKYACFADLEAACRAFMATVNGTHRTTKRVPAPMLAEERLRLHRSEVVPGLVELEVAVPRSMPTAW